jgi:hypothetical protein
MSDYFEVITNAVTGKVTNRPYTAAEIAAMQPTADQLRAQRDRLLISVVDPMVSNPLRWADLTPEKQTAWATYRRALLDVPQQPKFPEAVVWPTQPT